MEGSMQLSSASLPNAANDPCHRWQHPATIPPIFRFCIVAQPQFWCRLLIQKRGGAVEASMDAYACYHMCCAPCLQSHIYRFIFVFIYNLSLYEYLIWKFWMCEEEKRYIQMCGTESSQFWIRCIDVLLGMCLKLFFNTNTIFSQSCSEWEGMQ